MTGEQIRKRGLAVAAAGIALIAWVVVVAVTTEVGNPPVLAAAAMAAGMVCLCVVAAGAVASRVTERTAARMRHVFVVLTGASVALLFPSYWITFDLEPARMPEAWTLGPKPLLLVPPLAAAVLAAVPTRAVHRMLFEADGPLVPEPGEGAPARRVQALGTVLVVAGSLLAVAAVAVSSMSGNRMPFFLFSGLVVTLGVVLYGVLLTRVTNVYMARRKYFGGFVGAICGLASPVSTFGFETVSSVLIEVVVFGALVLVVVAAMVLAEYTGEFHTPLKERRRWRVRS
ncbi:hypothetical protein ABZX92_01680 [Lentzea sp. NPDC006480]|uniref:hypothetical protein n=1 Tax=Lentzea sp. NPDC006480 TaxID=3157176 RepID=UPI0033A243F5